jgi:hypothetical protein
LSYFPTEEEFELGGYEVYWSLLIYYKYFNRVFPFEKESASKLIGYIVQEKLIALKEKEALAKQVFTFPGAIPTKSEVRSTTDARRLDFGGV